MGYREVVLADTPLGYWRLNGDATDESGNNRNGTTSGVTWGAGAPISGEETNQYADFDGAGDYVRWAAAAWMNSPQITAEAWVWLDDITSTRSIINRMDATNGDAFTLRVDAGQVTLHINDGSTWVGFARDPDTLSTGRWYHVVGTYDGVDAKVYVDGALKATTTLNAAISQPVNARLHAGLNGGDADDLDGRLVEAAYYDRALTQAEILEHYAAGVSQIDYARRVLEDGPAGYWRLEGDLTDLSGNGNDGSASGGPLSYASGLIAAGGQGVDLNGTDQSIQVPDDASLDFTTGMTAEAWITPEAGAAGGIFISKRDNNSYAWELSISNDDKFLARVNSNANVAESLSTFTPGALHHVVMTYDQAYIRLYVNGSLEDEFAYSSAITTNNVALAIGQRNYIGVEGFFAGVMDEVAVYDRALTQAEVLEHYAVGVTESKYARAVIQDAPVGYWRLEDDFQDAIGFGHHGSAVNGGPSFVSGLLDAGGKAGQFDGVDSGVDLPNIPALTNATEASIECWVQMDAGWDDTRHHAFLRVYEQFNGEYFDLNYLSGLGVRFRLDVGTSNPAPDYKLYDSTITAAELAAGPHHYVGTWDGSVARLYRDGVLVDSLATPSDPLAFTGVEAGSIGHSYHDNSLVCEGTIDECALYASALTQAEVMEHYRAGKLEVMAASGFLARHVAGDADFPFDLDDWQESQGTVSLDAGRLKWTPLDNSWQAMKYLRASLVGQKGHLQTLRSTYSDGDYTFYGPGFATDETTFEDDHYKVTPTEGRAAGELNLLHEAINRVYTTLAAHPQAGLRTIGNTYRVSAWIDGLTVEGYDFGWDDLVTEEDANAVNVPTGSALMVTSADPAFSEYSLLHEFFFTKDRYLYITGAPAGATINLKNSGGTVLASATADASGDAILDLLTVALDDLVTLEVDGTAFTPAYGVYGGDSYDFTGYEFAKAPTITATATGKYSADLAGSLFADVGIGGTHAASQWQVQAAGGDWSAPVVDTGTDAVNLTAYSTGDVLNPDNLYEARVRYQNDVGTWSDWSAPDGFTTVANIAPTADFSLAKTYLQVDVDAAASSDPDGTIDSYAWDWGDGSAAGAGITASHTYAAPGTYTITLTVTDSDGATSQATQDVTVNAQPEAVFSGTIDHLTLDVDASASVDPGGSIVSYEWDFGDGTQATGVAATHRYAQAGTFTVTLTVTDDVGGTDVATLEVVADTVEPSCPVPGETAWSDCPVPVDPGSSPTDPWALYLLDEEDGTAVNPDESGNNRDGAYSEWGALESVDGGPAVQGRKVIRVLGNQTTYPIRPVWMANGGTDPIDVSEPTLYAVHEAYANQVGMPGPKSVTVAFWLRSSQMMGFNPDKRGLTTDHPDPIIMHPPHGNSNETARRSYAGGGIDVGTNGIDVWGWSHNYVDRVSYVELAPYAGWRHYVVIFDAEQVLDEIHARIYVDGVLAESHPDMVAVGNNGLFWGPTGGSFSTDNFRVVVMDDGWLHSPLADGHLPGTKNPVCDISEAVYWDRKLTEAEIQEVYQEGAYRPSSWVKQERPAETAWTKET